MLFIEPLKTISERQCFVSTILEDSERERVYHVARLGIIKLYYQLIKLLQIKFIMIIISQIDVVWEISDVQCYPGTRMNI